MEWIIFKSNQRNPASDIAFNKLSSKNKEVVKKWLYEKAVLSKSEKRAGNRKRTIVKLLTFLKKDYDRITYDDYVNVASAISKSNNGVNQKNSDRNFISRFLKDNYEDWEKRFKGLKLFKLETESEDKKLKSKDLLTELEIDKLIKATSSMKEKSLIAVLSISAARPEELLKLRWSDVDFKNKLIYLFSGKTKKKRFVPIDLAINHLERLKKETNASDDDLVFPSCSNKIMTIAGLNYMLHRVAEKAGIKKRVWAYLFRHTKLSFLITKLSGKVYEEISGHSLQMGMRTYAHLSQDEIIKEMREKVFEIEDLTSTEREKINKIMNQQQQELEKVKKIAEHSVQVTEEYSKLVEEMRKKLKIKA